MAGGRKGGRPTLLDLCVESAIDNRQLLGDVGQTDLSLLRRILPHCSADQLHRIEAASSGRDLSSITDELWHQFYLRKFGPDNEKLVSERMRKRGVFFLWRLLYQAKVKEQEEVQQKCVDRLKQLYVEADMKKQSRQIQLCTKVPPSSKRRNQDFGCGGSTNSVSNVKGRLMKKAKLEYAESYAAKMHAATKNRCAVKTTIMSSYKKTNLASQPSKPSVSNITTVSYKKTQLLSPEKDSSSSFRKGITPAPTMKPDQRQPAQSTRTS